MAFSHFSFWKMTWDYWNEESSVEMIQIVLPAAGAFQDAPAVDVGGANRSHRPDGLSDPLDHVLLQGQDLISQLCGGG